MNAARTTLLSPEELAAWIAEGRQPVILDASFDLADTGAGERRFAAGHIPGAHYVHLDRDLAGVKTGRNGRHPLPERSTFARRMGALGSAPACRSSPSTRRAASTQPGSGGCCAGWVTSP
jgi:thiosulfate/3-mercaptopyruvate sulfurtransferase